MLEKMPTVVMDSSTYGVPVNSPQGYKVTVADAVRIDNSGNFVHSAPWSVGARASAMSVTAASTSARPTPSGSSTTSAAVTRSW
ncbi:conserved secretory domain protein [Mycobacterium ulcerans str. Harvey]|uniref:Conserved secretory domain protein n=1 Tax=Mycobacterium ulcerans str. Harvey TaxID=1299332 RepID=A0ABP3APW2_MYCUL|nr:conserved secretory domain protein [Mycobacterium ulcerans str. Harvey]